jgi:GNAT superfamily N-acetyltransferase
MNAASPIRPLVRPLTQPSDADIAQLADTLVACVAAGASIGWVQAPSLDAAQQFWQGVAASTARGERLWWVAEHQGRCVGSVNLVLAQPENGALRAEVVKLMVHPEARRLGLAQALMGAAEAEASRLGKRLLVLDTNTDSPAETLYIQRGWQRCGVMPDYAIQADGRLGATTWMFKRLT